MKKLLIFIFSMLVLTIQIQAQQKYIDCGTKPPAKPRPIPEKDMQRFLRSINAVSAPYCVKVYFTVFANNDGSNRATTDAHIYRQFQNMVNQYSPQGICFALMGIRQVNNTDWNIQDANDEEAEIRDVRITGNLNIFVHNVLVLGEISLNGVAYDIPNTDAFISLKGEVVSDTTNLTTMAHEVGHVFGLYHTFEKLYGAESVARSGACKNCENTGDYLCDTPADPDDTNAYLAMNTDSTCTYTGTAFDACFAFYTPDVSNIMAYGRRACRNNFTAAQGNRMRFFISTESGLLAVLAQNDSGISGPVSFSSGSGMGVARDSYTIQTASGAVLFNGNSNYTFQSRKVVLGSGARLSPGNGGKVHLRTNPYCN